MYSIVTHNNNYQDSHRFAGEHTQAKTPIQPIPTNNPVLDSRCVRTHTRGITVTTTTTSGTSLPSLPFLPSFLPSFHPPLPIPGSSNPNLTTPQGQQHRSLLLAPPLGLLLRRLVNRHVFQDEDRMRRLLELLLH